MEIRHAKTIGLTILIALGCRRPLAPGETRCTSVPIGGVMSTHCQTGQAAPPPPSFVYVHDEPAPAAAQPMTNERKIVEGDHPMWCTVATSDPNYGSCYVSADECAGFLERAKENPDFTIKMSDCLELKAAACFNYTVILTEQRRLVCVPSILNCERQLASLRQNPDYRIAATQCGIYRERAP